MSFRHLSNGSKLLSFKLSFFSKITEEPETTTEPEEPETTTEPGKNKFNYKHSKSATMGDVYANLGVPLGHSQSIK